MTEIQFYIFFVIIIVSMIGVLIVAIVRMVQINTETKAAATVQSITGQKQPPVTILVYSRNNFLEALETAYSFLDNNYTQFDVVVINELKSDDEALMRQYIRHHATQSKLSFLQRRTDGTVHDALKAGYRKSRKGKVVIAVKAGLRVDQNFIQRSSLYRQNSRMWTTRVKEIPMTQGTPASLTIFLSKIRRMFWHSHEVAEVFTSQYFLRVNLLNKVIVPPETFVAFSFVAVGTVLYTGIVQDSFIVMWFLWVLFMAYILGMIWLDITEKLSSKLKLTLLAPSAFFLLPIASCLQGISQIYKRK